MTALAKATRSPRLIPLLMDLPEPDRLELASRWGCPPAAARIYDAMTDPARLAERLPALGQGCPEVLRAVADEPTTLVELLGRVALGRETVERCLAQLGELGLVVRVGPGGRPQPVRSPVGSARLAVPRELTGLVRAPAGGRGR